MEKIHRVTCQPCPMPRRSMARSHPRRDAQSTGPFGKVSLDSPRVDGAWMKDGHESTCTDEDDAPPPSHRPFATECEHDGARARHDESSSIGRPLRSIGTGCIRGRDCHAPAGHRQGEAHRAIGRKEGRTVVGGTPTRPTNAR